ncbi:MAG: TetR/AcrR family transcriptional regulator [Melioribacteraceae bacterium]|nr:TetR/AcrR family transcriptional regulator [Melioribacteraceae bacterium]
MTQRQSEILQESIKLIADKGIQGLTMKNLANAIGVTEPAIYRHFENKQKILLGILSLFENNKEIFSKFLQDETSNPLEQLKLLVKMRFKYFAKNRAIASVIFSEELFRNDPLLSEKVFEIMKENQKIFVQIIKAGQKLSVIKKDVTADQLTLIIIGAIRLIVTKWRLSGCSFNLEKEGAYFWKSIEILIKI